MPDSTLISRSRFERSRVTRLGFVPLSDAAPLLVAEALGLFEAVGVNVALSAEPGWATLRDKPFPHLARGSVAANLAGEVTLAHPMRFRAATFPRADEAAWWLRQMQRWGHLPADADHAALLAPWNAALWHAAAKRLNEPVPVASSLEQPA